jgi:hypothetical protein
VAAQEWPSEDEDAGVLVEGVVVDDATGDSLSGAAVSLGAGPGVRGRGTRVTGEGGRFSFSDVPAGTYRIVVRFEGFRDMNDTIPVPSEGDLELILPLATGSVLEPVVVAEVLPEAVPGYERRRRGGARFLITREDIEEQRPRYLSELLHRMPGGMVVPTPPHGYTLLLRGQCRPGIWVDGVPMPGAAGVDRLVVPQDVEALEVYHGFELPVEFGVDECGGILIWTRRGPSLPPQGEGEEVPNVGFFGRLIGIAAVVLVVVVLTR